MRGTEQEPQHHEAHHQHHRSRLAVLSRALQLSLLKLRTRAQRLFRMSDAHTMLVWSAVVGFGGACATIAFREGITLFQHLFSGYTGSFTDIAKHLPPLLRMALPALGGLLAGFVLLLAQRSATRKERTDYMEAVALGDGVVPIRVSLWRTLSSLLTISSGGSIGREGPMVQLAALVASLAGRVLHFDPARLRLLVACGAAAGITSAYNAPIAGAFFVSEIVLGSISMDSFGPLVFSSVVANIVMREVAGYRPPYEMPVFPTVTGGEVVLFVALGLLCGLLAPLFLRLLEVSKRGFRTLPLPLPARLALGGLLVGLISVWVPDVWGNGYSVVNQILHTPWTWQALATVLIFKVLATAATSGSGGVGGVFTPTLFVGATFGSLFGLAMHALLPAHVSAAYAYAMVGMGAFLAGATQAPLMAILMIFEMTLSYEVVLPLMVSCVVAYFVARAVGTTSMYEITLHRHQEEEERLRLQSAQMRELVQPALTTISPGASVPDMTRAFLEYPVKYLYVTDDDQCFLGAVALTELTSDLLNKRDTTALSARDYMRDMPALLTPDMSLGAALQRFMEFRGERLPVVEDLGRQRLMGVVYKTTLLDAYRRLYGQNDLH